MLALFILNFQIFIFFLCMCRCMREIIGSGPSPHVLTCYRSPRHYSALSDTIPTSSASNFFACLAKRMFRLQSSNRRCSGLGMRDLTAAHDTVTQTATPGGAHILEELAEANHPLLHSIARMRHAI